MAIKVSKYVIRMMNAKKGILPSNIQESSIKKSPIETDCVAKNHEDSFEDYVEYNEMFYLGHYEKADTYTYVCSHDIFVLKLLNCFEEQFKNNDLKTVSSATDSKFKELKGFPLHTYKVDFYPIEYNKTDIDDISHHICPRDRGNTYTLRLQVDDQSNFIAYNTLTAIYYFHNNIDSVKKYLSYFSYEQQLENLQNTVDRFEKDTIKLQSRHNSFDRMSLSIAQNMLPIFQSLLLEKKLENEIPEVSTKPKLAFKL